MRPILSEAFGPRFLYIEHFSRQTFFNRHEGLAPTAEAARCRLEALGSMDPVTNPATSHEALAALKASKAELKSWTVRWRLRSMDVPMQAGFVHLCAPSHHACAFMQANMSSKGAASGSTAR